MRVSPSRKKFVGWPYYTALLLPLWCLGFLLSAPHAAGDALFWLLPVAAPVVADYLGVGVSQKADSSCGGMGLDALPLLLAGLFVVDTGLLLAESRHWGWTSSQAVDTLAMLAVVKFLFGSNAAIAGLLTAHELIHRRSPFLRATGRILLIVCCYEHFATEHLRGHHRRVGWKEDPATARFGETYSRFWRRSVGAQFLSAWRLESRRLRMTERWDRRWLSHRVLQGVAAELGLLAAIGWGFGPLALLAFCVQALMGIRNLEAINYVQHWGLQRARGKPGPQHAWYTDSWCSHYLILGLARHSHHHCRPGLPYYRLQVQSEAPRLPYGYFALMFMVAYRNRAFQKAASAELNRVKRQNLEKPCRIRVCRPTYKRALKR
ncbi:MAG: fatty acid desaturase [Methylohalobius sp. ZOD2]